MHMRKAYISLYIIITVPGMTQMTLVLVLTLVCQSQNMTQMTLVQFGDILHSISLSIYLSIYICISEPHTFLQMSANMFL